MGKVIYKERFVECARFRFNFYMQETYTETDEPGAYRLTSTTTCPALNESKGYTQRRCGGTNKYGLPCSYATSECNSGRVYHFPDNP